MYFIQGTESCHSVSSGKGKLTVKAQSQSPTKLPRGLGEGQGDNMGAI